MSAGRVLVVEDDPWVSRLLARALEARGFDAKAVATATEGLALATEGELDCVVCDLSLPDHDGLWLAEHLRTADTRGATCPILFLAADDDERTVLDAFHVGADACMVKPLHIDEAVAQIAALVAMAGRLRERRDSLLEADGGGRSSFSGDLAHLSIATVLTLLELERRSGRLRLRGEQGTASFDLDRGALVSAEAAGVVAAPLLVLRDVLRWRTGRFSFRSVTSGDGPAPARPDGGRTSIGALLLDAVRLDDEDSFDAVAAAVARVDAALHPPSSASSGVAVCIPPRPAAPRPAPKKP